MKQEKGNLGLCGSVQYFFIKTITGTEEIRNKEVF